MDGYHFYWEQPAQAQVIATSNGLFKTPHCLCIFFMLPKLVLVTQCNSWKIHLLHIVEFHIDTLFELQEVRDSVGGIVEKYTRGCQHNNTPDYPV